jgi:hypothetical protein
MRKPWEYQIGRFWARVEKSETFECWPWTLTWRKDGYGEFRLPGRVVLAHRFAFMASNDRWEIEDLVVRHSCDFPACCNPAHLSVGTHSDNVADRDSRGRSARGERHGRAKLTSEQVAAIRASALSDLEIAVRLRIHKTTVHKIRAGRLWRADSMGRVWEEPVAIPFLREAK